MFKRTRICSGLMLAFGGTAIALAALPALAQQTLEKVEITGSNIKRVDSDTASPVQVITKQEIDQSGKGTVAEYLQTLTADGQGSVPFTYGRGFSGATSSGISLRGLGSNATLVLINGRRVTSAVLADDAQRTYVDLNQIPLEAVERVEVVKDGASAIYGSDAVAGVVNIILRKSFSGTVLKATYGMSEKGDGNEPRVAITHGFGDMAKDGYNVLLNAEFGKKDPIYYRDRMGRGSVGVSAIGQPQWGYDPNVGPTNNAPRAGGDGWIVSGPNAASPSIVGNVLRGSDTTQQYVSRGAFFPGAQAYCNANANLPQNNPAGGCITDLRQAVNQIQPEHQTASFFGRFNKQISGDLEGFVELGYYSSKSTVDGLPPSASGGYFTPDGVVHSQTGATQLGANHPDNPFPGEASRLQYRAMDIGASAVDSTSHSTRFLAGLKGTLGVWDFDTALAFSEAKQTDTSTKLLNWRVKNALLNPTQANIDAATAFSPAYAALPAGTYWRIGENASLNSPQLYAALLADKQREGYSRQYGVDFKASREIGKLPGGPIGLAVGGEVRHEANNLGLYDGLGDYVGLSLTAYGGKRDIYAAFTEVVAPVTKQLELNAALRYDHYSDAGNALTPKVGVKFKALDSLALRATFAKGFRAPSSTENSAQSVAAFGGANISDNARCNAIKADRIAAGDSATAAAAFAAPFCQLAPTFVQRGNPALEPEKSESVTLGLIWDLAANSSVTADLWQIKRKGLPVIEDPQGAVDAGRVTRDASTTVTANDPGQILSGFVVFQNSSQSLTRGIDLEAKHRFDLGGGMGRLTLGGTLSHMFTQRVIDADGTVHDYAGTHGDCNITNCMGSPKDRISLSSTWDMNQWRLGANVNYRGSMSYKAEKSDTACTDIFGEVPPGGCTVKSFTTLDISGAYKFGKNTEVFGSIANLFDTKPPSDFATYGAIGYNPLDYSGAIGRYYRIGVKHQF
jgi:iron complex outermembrane recepter protein